jgi:hypothetical protein
MEARSDFLGSSGPENAGEAKEFVARNSALIRRIAFLLVVSGGISLAPYAFAQPADGSTPHLAQDVVPAPAGYEKIMAHYVAAHPTALYISPFIWAGKVLDSHLDAGQPVDLLAQAKGYDWFLVGKDGEGIGYVPASALTKTKNPTSAR